MSLKWKRCAECYFVKERHYKNNVTELRCGRSPPSLGEPPIVLPSDNCGEYKHEYQDETDLRKAEEAEQNKKGLYTEWQIRDLLNLSSWATEIFYNKETNTTGLKPVFKGEWYYPWRKYTYYYTVEAVAKQLAKMYRKLQLANERAAKAQEE